MGRRDLCRRRWAAPKNVQARIPQTQARKVRCLPGQDEGTDSMTAPYGHKAWSTWLADNANRARWCATKCATCGLVGHDKSSGFLYHWYTIGDPSQIHCGKAPMTFGAAHGLSICKCPNESMFPGINCPEDYVGAFKAAKTACDCGGSKLGYAPGKMHSFWNHPKDKRKWCPLRIET
jgi:hypothetical protein